MYQVMFTMTEDIPGDVEDLETWVEDQRLEVHPFDIITEAIEEGGDFTIDMTTELLNGV